MMLNSSRSRSSFTWNDCACLLVFFTVMSTITNLPRGFDKPREFASSIPVTVNVNLPSLTA